VTPICEKYYIAPKPDSDFDLRINKLLADLRNVVTNQTRQRVDHHLKMKYNTTAELFRKGGGTDFLQNTIRGF
jgi:hypothetical protein